MNVPMAKGAPYLDMDIAITSDEPYWVSVANMLIWLRSTITYMAIPVISFPTQKGE